MSALPPKSDITQRDKNVRFVPKADSCTAAIQTLLDHLIGTGEERLGHVEAERFGGLQVDDKLVLCWLLHRKVRWFFTPKDAIGIDRGAAALISAVGSVADQTTVGDKQAVAVHCRQMELSRPAR